MQWQTAGLESQRASHPEGMGNVRRPHWFTQEMVCRISVRLGGHDSCALWPCGGPSAAVTAQDVRRACPSASRTHSPVTLRGDSGPGETGRQPACRALTGARASLMSLGLSPQGQPGG
ncbi:unnamed protein product [Arctogadus glacialis]